jgi:hypothetical protein
MRFEYESTVRIHKEAVTSRIENVLCNLKRPPLQP